jgi:protein TonB
MIGRVAFALIVAALVTGIILFTMQTLIATAPRELDESGQRHFVDFVRVERQETLQRKERIAGKPAQPEAPPTLGAQPRTDAIEPTEISVGLPVVETATELEIGGLGLDTVSGDYLPIVKAAPVYPWKARSALVQGHCIVEYTVTEAGTVKDVVVIEADPPGYFEKASIEAALKFKYKPRVVAGEPIEVRGVRNLFRYQLEE